MKTRKLISTFGLVFFLGTALWAIPPGFNIQGRLTDMSGVNRDGAFQIKFSVFSVAEGGIAVWEKTMSSVMVKNGNFQVILQGEGDVGGQLEDAVKNLDTAYVEIKIGTEPPLVPRQPLLRSPFSVPGFVGAVMYFARLDCPNGWVPADGRAIPRSGDYKDLFLALGTTFGQGNGTTTFNLPDLRGMFVRGWDSGGGAARNLDAGRTFGSYQEDEFKSHGHSYLNPLDLNGSGGSDGPGHHHNASYIETGSKGGNETRPKNLALMPCVRY